MMTVRTELFQWLNEQTDLASSQIDLVDGFVFMLRKIKQHGSIRLASNEQIHPRFWRSHDRTFGYHLMGKKRNQSRAHLYQFYFDVAINDQLLFKEQDRIFITEKGETYLNKKREEQLELLFSHIW